MQWGEEREGQVERERGQLIHVTLACSYTGLKERSSSSLPPPRMACRGLKTAAAGATPRTDTTWRLSVRASIVPVRHHSRSSHSCPVLSANTSCVCTCVVMAKGSRVRLSRCCREMSSLSSYLACFRVMSSNVTHSQQCLQATKVSGKALVQPVGRQSSV